MSTTTPPTPSSTPTIDATSRASLVHNVSLGALIVCPIVMALPPRKLDFYTIALISGTLMGGNQLLKEYTGRGIATRLQDRMESISSPKLPEKAREMQIRLREEKMRREGISIAASSGNGAAAQEGDVRKGGVIDELRKDAADKKDRGLIEKVWMGGEGDDWKAKRDQREREALAEGRGYGGLIVDQIWEVWNWGKDKTEEIKEIDEKVVQERNENKK